jgi:hypothetical protein
MTHAPKHKTIWRAVVAVSAAALLGAGIGACGGDAPSAQSLVRETFHSDRQIESGRLDLGFSLASSGLTALGAPVSVRVSGPFESKGAAALPRFAMSVGLQTGGPPGAETGGSTLELGAISTSSQFFVVVGGQAYQAPESAVAALQQSYAKASTQASANNHSTFASLGVDPSQWLQDPVVVGEQSIEGVATYHLRAHLDVERFLADLGKLSGLTSALGRLGTKAGSVGALLALLEPAGTAALTRSVRNAQVDIFTTKTDHQLRLLTLSVSIAPSAADRATLGGLQSARLAAHVGFADLGSPQRIVAPANPRPLSELLSALQRFGLASGAGGEA